jgi:hypothetical protein
VRADQPGADTEDSRHTRQWHAAGSRYTANGRSIHVPVFADWTGICGRRSVAQCGQRSSWNGAEQRQRLATTGTSVDQRKHVAEGVVRGDAMSDKKWVTSLNDITRLLYHTYGSHVAGVVDVQRRHRA